MCPQQSLLNEMSKSRAMFCRKIRVSVRAEQSYTEPGKTGNFPSLQTIFAMANR